MTYQLALSAAFALCAVAYYLLRRLWKENLRLASAEKLSRDCLRDAIRSRDEMYVELCEERARCVELRLELMAYRAEAGSREMGRIYS